MVLGRELSQCTSAHPTASALNPKQVDNKETEEKLRISARVVCYIAADLF